MKISTMLMITITMAILSLIAFCIAYQRGEHLRGLLFAKKLIFQVLALLIFAFILAGMLQVLIPADLIAKFIGRESGLKGIFLGAIAGGFLPGGPFVAMPIGGRLCQSFSALKMR